MKVSPLVLTREMGTQDIAGRKAEIILLRESGVKPTCSEAAQEEVCSKRWGHLHEASVGIRRRSLESTGRNLNFMPEVTEKSPEHI